MDARSRELYLLFRGCQGYKASLLKPSIKNGKTSAPVGFVTFATRQDADEARRQLQGVRFDPENPQTLRLELARSNTKVTKQQKQLSPTIISPSNMSATAVGGMLPPPILGNNYMTSANHAAAAAYAAAAQQAAAAMTDSSTNGGIAGMDQFSFLNAMTAEQQHQQSAAAVAAAAAGFPLMPFSTSQAAALQMFSPVSTALGTSSAAAQQAAISAAMVQFQQQQQNAALAASMHQSANGYLAAATAAAAPLSISQQNPQPPNILTTQASLQQQQQQQTAALMAAAAAAAANNYGSMNLGNPQQQPCSTLFVANLGQNVNEEEMKQLFRAFPGFSRLRMHNKGGSPVAFVEYYDVRQAMTAMAALQGFLLSSSERNNGIRIEFARTKMGEVSHTNGNSGTSNGNSSS